MYIWILTTSIMFGPVTLARSHIARMKDGLRKWVGQATSFSAVFFCYHTAAYTRMLWHENIFLEDDPEEAYKNRIKSEWQPVASLESIACRWPDYHNHCVGKHPMLRSSEGLRLADDYCVMLKNWCHWHDLKISVWKRDVRAWKRVSPDV